MTMAQPNRAFDFGRNWQDYSSTIDDCALAAAEIGLLSLFDASDLRRARFLDIGCGSGIHALAAAKLGAEVTAIDCDPQSVAATRSLFARHNMPAEIHQRSILDEPDGQFDIVYAWGSLHHTGDLWRALGHAFASVRPGGKIVLAIYLTTPLCLAWKLEKRLYSKLSRAARTVPKILYGIALLARLSLARRRGPWEVLSAYRRERGMSFWHDVDDWLGGYPYQSASAREVREAGNLRGFIQIASTRTDPGIGFFGTGCAEYVFRRDHENASTLSVPLARSTVPPLSF